MNYENNYYNVMQLADTIRSSAREGKSVPPGGLGAREAYGQKYADDFDAIRAKYINEARDSFAEMQKRLFQEEEVLAAESLDIPEIIADKYPNERTEGGDLRPRKNPTKFAGDLKEGNLSERELLALTLQAEAGGEGELGMLAAGAVIDNRVKTKGYGDSFTEVILAPGQFSAWNSLTGYAKGEGGLDMSRIRPSETALKVADAILSGEYESPVGNATHYYNPAVADPKWGKKGGGDWLTIGNHVFGYGN